MTSSAPIDRTISAFRVLQTAATLAPNARASCTANVPTPPDAPLTSTVWPDSIRPMSRRASSAVMAAAGIAAASSYDRVLGLGVKRLSLTVVYSAKPPSRNSP